jgi:hypothetical protein
MAEVRVLKWRRVPREEDGSDAWSATYEATDEHGVAGSAVRTGRYGSDDYPWDWHIDKLHEPPAGVRVRTGGSADTLRSAKDQAEQAARLTRDTKGEWR